MKKLLQSLFLLLFIAFQAVAQERAVTGIVTDKTDGLPLPGVSIKATGTTSGTTTDGNGRFSLQVPSGSSSITFSYIGYLAQTVTIGKNNVLNVSLTGDAQQLAEIIITGVLGTSQSVKSTGYNAQVVKQEQLNTIRQPNLNNALAGKVAGLQVRSQSVAALGRQTEVRLRGASGFATGSGALYIVDGTILPNSDDLNLDDIESVSVLQGPAASAQYGSQAANGAIVITTVKGKKAAGVGVTFNLGAQFDNVNVMPNYQNSYAGGAAADLMKYTYKAGDPVEWKALEGKFYHDYSDDASWGPRMAGQEYIPWYSWYGGHDRSFQTSTLSPREDDARQFFNTGVNLNNSISFANSSDVFSFRLSYGNNDVKGLLPTTKLQKNTLNLNTSYNITPKLQVSANVNYINRRQQGEITDDYSNQSSGSFNQWYHRNLDMGIMKELRGLRTSDGIYASWNHANPTSFDSSNPRNFYAGNYWYNFYTWFDLINIGDQRDRLFGNLSGSYKINNDFTLSGTYRKQQNTAFAEEAYSSRLNESGLQTTGNSPEAKGFYSTGTSFSNRQNLEFLLSYKKNIKDFSINANVGSDFFTAIAKSNGSSTNNGLSVPDLFTAQNSVDPATISNGRVAEKYRAVLGKGVFGYKNFLFAGFSLRNDWFSTLPQDNNSVLSKSVEGSFVFSDLIPEVSWLSYGKLRGSWGEIPKALGTTNESFGAYRYPGFSYGVNQFKWNGNFLMGTPDQLVDPNIRGSVVSQMEIGLDLQFFKNRLGLSSTYWKGSEKDFPYALDVNGATGYTSLLTNIGEITKEGFEFQLTATPLKLRNFEWNMNATWSPLIKNEIVELSKEYNITQTASVGQVYGSTTGMPYMVHTEGKRWGQIYGNGIKRLNGQPILNASGLYVNDPAVFFGSVLPDHTGGLQNTFSFLSNFLVNVNIDYQVGGKFASLSNMWGSYSGLTARTAGVNDKGNPIRDAVANGGGVHVNGVDDTGKPVDYYVEAQTYFHQSWDRKVFDEYIYDLTFVKMRELSLGYRIPVSKLNLGKRIQNAQISLVARNPLLIYAKTKDFDPSEIDAVYGETGQLPGTRGIGFNLKVGF
ncbi:SusC/RagA family TonB-linked outer membrane protein [Daejeonella sp.]|uniref:SusC/RagA family TonB-linked outer membrane protein n=1 Tax=Daejeonella sp. TaxID=2805397 RepID=UPI0030BA55FF